MFNLLSWSGEKFVFYNPFYDELFVVSSRMAQTVDRLGLVYIGRFGEPGDF